MVDIGTNSGIMDTCVVQPRAHVQIHPADVSIDNMCKFIEHIISNYHAPLRRDLRQAANLLIKLNIMYSDDELVGLSLIFDTFRRHLIHHMDKEESVIFPICEGKLSLYKPNNAIDPLRIMLIEHKEEIGYLDEIAKLTNNFTPRQTANSKIVELYKLLSKINLDLRNHTLIEDELFSSLEFNLLNE